MASSEPQSETFDAAFFERLIRNPRVSLLFPYIVGLTTGASLPTQFSEYESESESDPESRGRLYVFDPQNRLMMMFDNPEDFEDLLRAMPQGKDGPSPASKASIAAMPAVAVAEEGALCSICLEDLEIGGEAKEMPCKHGFHGMCIEKWLGIHGSCPICRYQMPAEEEEQNEKGEEGEGEGEGEEGEGRREISVRLVFNYSRRRLRRVSSDPNPERQPFGSDAVLRFAEGEDDADAADESSAPQDMEH